VPTPCLIVYYDYVPDVLERRGPHREAHLAHIRAWEADGRLAIAGATGDPPTGAAIVIAGDDPARAEQFVEGDPYVAAGLVSSYRIVPYTVVTGG
jgi:uncharacterized protein YciI